MLYHKFEQEKYNYHKGYFIHTKLCMVLSVKKMFDSDFRVNFGNDKYNTKRNNKIVTVMDCVGNKRRMTKFFQ